MPAPGLAAGRALAWEEFRRGTLEPQSRPFKASIEVTRNCNHRCVMCSQSWDPRYSRRDPALDMTPELFGRVAGELFPRLEYAHLQGFGESTHSPHWDGILDRCAEHAGALRFGLVTNLSHPDPAMWRRLMELDFVVVFSCDGATAGTYERIRAGGRFAQVRENLEALRRARAELGRGRLYFYSVLQRLNLAEMPALVDFAAASGADRITFTSVNGEPYLPDGAGGLRAAAKALTSAAAGALGVRARLLAPPGEPLSLDGVPAAVLERAREAALERGRALGLPVRLNDAALAGGVPPLPPLETLGAEEGIRASAAVAAYGRCFKPYSYLAVDYDGGVGPCNYLTGGGPEQRMGSLAESGFDEIWNGAPYRAFRRALNEGRPERDGCRWCFARRLDE